MSSSNTKSSSSSSGCWLLILHNATIVTMDSDSRVFLNGAIVIEDDKIKAIGHSDHILTQFSSLSSQLVDLKGQFVLPGFINTHVHTSQQLARGIADDVDLLTWLHHRIWPYESNMTEEDSYISTLLCGIELIHSGVTCFAEAGGQHVSGMARAVEVLGIRACLVESIMDSGQGLPFAWANRTTEQCIQSQKKLYKKHHNTADGRIRMWLGIRQIMNSTDRLLIETRDTAKELKTGIHMHVAEIPYENHVVVDTRGVDHGTVSYLEKIKLLDENLLAAHTVWVNKDELSFLSRAGVKVSHCPASAMRMLGFAPIRDMLDSGICVSLGTDGAPSNNRMSIVDEMYLASLINKGREVFHRGTTDPTVLPAETILKMATIHGAKSVLWDEEIGSLEVGKKADIIVANPSSWSMVPLHDCISSLVYSMRTENIVSVMCNGKWIMKDLQILTVDEGEVISVAKVAAAELLKSFGGFPPYSPEPPVQHSKQPLTAPVKKSSASPKLVQIPVHFVGSEASRSEPRYRSASALKIQKVFRGFLVRRSMKKITAIRRDVDEIERRISQSEALEWMRGDDRERLRVNEMLMALLFKLDSVRGVDSGVRDFRRFVTKKAIALQERLDAIVPAVVDQTEIQISSELKDDSHQSGDAEAQTLESAASDAGVGEVSVDAPNSENSGDNCGRVEEQNPPQESADGLCDAQESADHFELKVDRENCVENGVDNNFIMVEVDSGTRGEEEVPCVDKENCDSDYNILSMDERGDESPVRNDANDVSDSVNHVEEMPEEENEKEKTDNNKRNQELMEKMIEDNQKMMNMMSQLCEKNEKQTKMLNALTKRVEQLEKAYVCHILRRKKGRHSD